MFADSPKEERYIFDGEVHLGEIMVSLDKIEEQAKENNVSLKRLKMDTDYSKYTLITTNTLMVTELFLAIL